MYHPGLHAAQLQPNGHIHPIVATHDLNQAVPSPHASPLASVIESMIVPLQYADPHRLTSDVMTLLHQTNSLKPVVGQHVTNSGQTSSLLSLTGTVPMYYKGMTYHIPVALWLPLEYPFRPPHLYVTPTREMRIKDRHKHVDQQGVVYLPYLNQWSAQSTLVDLVVIVSTVFSDDPPVFKVTTPQTGSQSVAQSHHHHSISHPPVAHPPAIQRPHSSSVSMPVVANHHPVHSPIGQQPVHVVEPVPQISPRTTKRALLVEEMTRATQQALREYSATSSAEVDRLLRENEKVMQHSEKMKLDMEAMQAELDALQCQSEHNRKQSIELTSWLETYEAQAPSLDDIDEWCQPRDALSSQQFMAMSQDSAIDDALFVLDRALNDGVIDLKDYIKNVRQLSKQQFYHRAMTSKIFKIQQELPRLRPPPQPSKSPQLPPRTSAMRPIR